MLQTSNVGPLAGTRRNAPGAVASNAAQSSSGALVSVENLSLTYRGRSGHDTAVLEELSFTANAGEFVSIIGPSGCGKSTLLKVVAGLIPPTQGCVSLRSGDTEPCRVGFCFQGDALLPWATAKGNIELAMKLSGETDSGISGRADALLAQVGLTEASSRYPTQLSGGMRKRVAIARALAYRPAVFLMDEPLGSLDAQTRIQVGNFFLELLAQSPATVLFVTHDIDEAVALADRVIVLSPSPAHIVASLEVPFERPRDYFRTRSEAGFRDVATEVWRQLAAGMGEE